MAILPALQSAAIRLIGRKPDTFFGGSGTFALEITDLVNEVAQDIAKYQDWQALVKNATITGNGSVTDFPLPDDYDRMLLNTDIQQSSSWFWSFQHITDVNEFINLSERGFLPSPGGWIITGDRLRLTPAPPSAPAAIFPYISNAWALGSDGAYKTAFTLDTDSFVLPERLLTLGLVWRWRENKKLDYTGDMEAFTKALSEYAAKDSGSRIIRRGGWSRIPNTQLAYPGWA